MAARKFVVDIDLQQQAILNAVAHPVVADPGTPANGQFWYRSDLKVIRYFDGTETKTLATGGDMINAITRTTSASAANQLVVSAGADRTAASYAPGIGPGESAIIAVDSDGVTKNAIPGTDYLTAASTNTLTNKTLNAEGTGNSVTNLKTSNFKAGVVVTSVGSASVDTELPTAKAVYDHVDARITALGQFVGDLDASTGLPTTGSGSGDSISKGDYWRVSVGGTIVDLGVLEVGDVVTARIDVAALATDFFVMQGNITDAVTSVETSSTTRELVAFNGTSGKVVGKTGILTEADGSINLPDGGSYKINGTDIATILAPKRYYGTFAVEDWGGASAPFSIQIDAATHGVAENGLLTVQLRDNTGNIIEADVQVSTAGLVTLRSHLKIAGQVVII